MSADPFDMMRQSVLAIQTQNELAAARVQIAALRKELAEAQENYHIVNEAAAKVRAQNEEIHADYEALANEHTKLTERHKALRASSFVTAVPVDEYERLKAEVERLRKAGDAMADEIIGFYNEEGYDPADFETLPKWNAAKEGKPSA